MCVAFGCDLSNIKSVNTKWVHETRRYCTWALKIGSKYNQFVFIQQSILLVSTHAQTYTHTHTFIQTETAWICSIDDQADDQFQKTESLYNLHIYANLRQPRFIQNHIEHWIWTQVWIFALFSTKYFLHRHKFVIAIS